jgi:hypothetical protein
MNKTGHDTESGRPERTQKMLAMTPGQTPVKKKLRLSFKEYHVMVEALSSYGRYKKQRTAVRNRYKLKNARRAAKRIVAGYKRLQKRSTNASLRAYYKTVLHGKKRKSLSPGEKSNMEKTFRRKYNKSNAYRKGSNVYGSERKMQSKRKQH